MTRETSSRRGLRLLLTAFGVVAVAFGAISILFGAGAVLGHGAASASVDSELRFYAAWYVVAGWLALRAAREPEREAFLIRVLCAGLLVGAGGRLISLGVSGRPHPAFMVLLALELLVPAMALWLQRSIR